MLRVFGGLWDLLRGDPLLSIKIFTTTYYLDILRRKMYGLMKLLWNIYQGGSKIFYYGSRFILALWWKNQNEINHLFNGKDEDLSPKTISNRLYFGENAIRLSSFYFRFLSFFALKLPSQILFWSNPTCKNSWHLKPHFENNYFTFCTLSILYLIAIMTFNKLQLYLLIKLYL